MLNTCNLCHRQHEVSHLDEGALVRCECGVTLVVEKIPPHEPRVLRCSSCGGLLNEGAAVCSSCGGEITLEERLLTEVCPQCYARMARGARYCMECGVAIRPQKITTIPQGAVCPRCRSALRSRVVNTVRIIECSACAGLWISPECFERILGEAEKATEVVSGGAPADVPRTSLAEPPLQYLPCPLCKTVMNRRNFGATSGVIIDYCRSHGLWLDHRELENILRFVRRGGWTTVIAPELERLKRRATEVRRQSGDRPLDTLQDGTLSDGWWIFVLVSLVRVILRFALR